jgi:hypothetical protein
MLCWARIVPNPVQQNTGCCCAKLVSGLRNRCEWRIGDFRKIKIVEAHDGNVLRASETSIPDREKDAKGNHVMPWDAE